MLSALRVSRFAVIEELEVGFGKGLTVLTGETGAGKSILVDALGLLLGGRADPEVIRAGSEEASVEALLVRTEPLARRLEELGLPDLGEEVSVRRVIHRAGRGKAYVNGALVTVGVLAGLMRGLIDLAGQHEQVHLYEPTVQRRLLDSFGETEEALDAYRAAFARISEVDAALASLGGDERQVAQRLDFLRYQVEELELLDPKPDEEPTLEAERRRLGAAEKLARATQEGLELLTADEGAQDRLGRVRRLFDEASRIDPKAREVLVPLETALAELEEAGARAQRYLSSLEADPARLGELEERLESLRRLARKHGVPIAELAARRGQLEEERQRLEHRSEEVERLSAERASAEAVAWDQAAALRERRKLAAVKLSRLVQEGLSGLALKNARFEVGVRIGEALKGDGVDEIDFLFSANPGEPLRPLSKVASGGEASRLLLALKRGLAAVDECACYVLDEADSGVSGAAADVVGRLIQEIAARRQVLCITHLPQVAAYADAHLMVRKRVEGERAFSEVVPLSESGARTRELARMLSGMKVTREAIGAAEALVRAARRARPRRPLKVA